MKIFNTKNELIHTVREDGNLSKTEDSYMSFGSQFRELGEGNLALPRIYDTYLRNGLSYIYFGNDNLFPQLVNQMYYTSPINGAIINFKVNASIGGGYTIKPNSDNPIDRAKCLVFEKRLGIKEILTPLMTDFVAHESCYLLLDFSKSKDKPTVKRIPREKVRNNRSKSHYFICDDWAGGAEIITYKAWRGQATEEKMVLAFEKKSLGIDTYTVPSYTSALNWMELDGKMSLMHKNNILNSIFPSFLLLFPKKPANEKEKLAIKTSIEGAKGAGNAGKIVTLFANKLEQMPKLEAIPTNQNDKLFEQTDERIDAQVCKAHCIDPLLMGIRVSGKLGSGNELAQSYTILEKNTILPIREFAENIFNTIAQIWGVPGKFEINEYQIINETIVQVEDENQKTIDALNSVPELLGTEIIRRMSDEQLLKIVGLKPDGKTKTQQTP